jgi:hypothetical protein
MSPRASAIIVLTAGALWPLLAVAGVQVVGLLGLANGLRAMRSLAGHGPEPVVEHVANDLELAPA